MRLCEVMNVDWPGANGETGVLVVVVAAVVVAAVAIVVDCEGTVVVRPLWLLLLWCLGRLVSGEKGVTVTAWCISEGNVWTVNIEVRGDEERGRLRGLGEGWVCIWVMWGVFRVETERCG